MIKEEKTRLIRLAVKKQNETDLLTEFRKSVKILEKKVKGFIRKIDRKELNEFIFAVAEVDNYIDMLRVKYGVEIESVKVRQLERIRKLYEPIDMKKV